MNGLRAAASWGMRPGSAGQVGLQKLLAGLHHMGPDGLRPALFVKESCRFGCIHVRPKFLGELKHVGDGNFGGDFLPPALFFQVNHFCFPTEWICLTHLEIAPAAGKDDGRDHRPL